MANVESNERHIGVKNPLKENASFWYTDDAVIVPVPVKRWCEITQSYIHGYELPNKKEETL